MARPPIPDNLKYTIWWLNVLWLRAKDSHLKDRWPDMEYFLADVAELVCASDDSLTEDARQIKREIMELSAGGKQGK